MEKEVKSRLTLQLDKWQKRLSESDKYWKTELDRMDEREDLFRGRRALEPLVPGDTNVDGSRRSTSHVRNVVFENIESQVSSNIPQPKVTPRRKKDERLAGKIEHFLRNELDRLPFEEINDLSERTVPLHGGTGYQVSWDNTKRSLMGVGELAIGSVHPKQLAPQPGVFTGVDDMDWFIIKVPTTKAAVARQFGISVEEEGESEPEVRSSSSIRTADDAVTMYVGYEKGQEQGINKYVWVNDIELENLENYQARRLPQCKRCGRVRPLKGQLLTGVPVTAQSPTPAEQILNQTAGHMMAQCLAESLMNGSAPTLEEIPVGGGEADMPRYDGGNCPWCGADQFEEKPQEYEEIIAPVRSPGGVEIPGAQFRFDEMGMPVYQPVRIPFYVPDIYPIVIQKSVSVFGQLLGSSDVDVIRDQQNTINRLEQKIIDRIVKAGTRITLPPRADIRLDSEDSEKIYLEDPSQKSMIGVYNFTGDLQYEMAYMAQVYEEARQMLGITNSLQGRPDPTATSGVAKEYSAAQAAGRFESKRIMKRAAYARLFEIMFKFYLAYADEPVTISYKDEHGQTQYEEMSRYDFLEQDADGQWHWNDQFLFSCDTAAPLSSNRSAMWQELRMNLQTGAFGDPARTDTLILFWTKMEEQHYPGAASTKKFLEQRREKELLAQGGGSLTMPLYGGAGSGVATTSPAEAVDYESLGKEVAV